MASLTSAKEWKKASQGEEVELPSGNVALIKRPGMESLFSAGVLPDELTKLALEQVQKAEVGPQDHKKATVDTTSGLDAKTMEKFMQTENAIGGIFEAFDRITAMCVIQPVCLFHKRRKVTDTGQQVLDDKDKPVWEEIPQADRDEEVIYTDDVDLDDKTFIFNYVVGGSRDIAAFRDEFGDAVATVQSRKDVVVPSKRSAKARK